MTVPLTSLIHLTGFATGIALYAMLTAMTWREVAAGRRAGEGGRGLPLIVALLGLTWNAGAMVIYGMRDFGLAQPASWLVGVAFAALGFLPAVVVHTALPPGRAWQRTPVALAYVLSGSAAAIFALGDGTATLPSRTALLVLTIGYLLLVTLVVLGIGGVAPRKRVVTAVALGAFAATALHLRHDVGEVDNWFIALLGHHASIPLGLVILYQDYHFAFVDLFLRRALSVIVLVAVAVALHVTVAAPLMGLMRDDRSESLLATAGHIALWVATALCYPVIARLTSRFVDRVILRRADYPAVRDAALTRVAQASTEDEAGAQVQALVADALRMAPEAARLIVDDGEPSVAGAVVPDGNGARAVVRVPTHDRPSLRLEVGPLPPGRRLLSDEILLLEWLATLLGRRLDVLRVARERFERDLREREITQLATESELRALRAQLNPHFLFNALTTLGYLMQAAPDRAMQTLFRLTGLLRAVLRGPAGEFVTLGEELDIVTAYLAIERERFQERLEVTIAVPDALRAQRIPPLVLQPLVENAVKHGIASLRRGGTIALEGRLLPPPARTLELVVADTGVGWGAAPAVSGGEGVGIHNIARRLERLYDGRATLSIVGAPGQGTTITLRLPLDEAGVTPMRPTALERAG